MQWFGWQDFGVPSKSSYDIVKELCDVMIRTVADGKGIVIHCSAGIGRTGTILAIVDAMRIINAGDFADLSIFSWSTISGCIATEAFRPSSSTNLYTRFSGSTSREELTQLSSDSTDRDVL